MTHNSIDLTGVPGPKPQACGFCGKTPRPNCWQGQMDYVDGSSRVCPNWSAFLEEREDAE